MQHWLLAALDEASEAIVVVDRIGREIVRNAAARHVTGARHGDLLAEDALLDVLAEAREGHSSERLLQLYGPPPQVLQLRAFPLRREGEVVGAVAFARDVSEARRVESVRRDFVANVSHELKTPIGALALLAETISATDDVAVVQRLAERVGTRGRSAVAHRRRSARPQPDRSPGGADPAAPSRSRSSSPRRSTSCRPRPTRGDVPVRVTPRPPDIEVICDPRQLRSALMNLLDNAIKYSAAGQEVEIGACVVRRSGGDRVAFIVRDHGIGIPTRDLERIFERFYRVDRARSRDTGGTGLGLSIVRHVAQAHGGDVTVQSREGEGSTFTLSVPIATEAPCRRRAPKCRRGARRWPTRR